MNVKLSDYIFWLWDTVCAARPRSLNPLTDEIRTLLSEFLQARVSNHSFFKTDNIQNEDHGDQQP